MDRASLDCLKNSMTKSLASLIERARSESQGWKLVSASHVVQGGSGRVSDCICLLLFVSSKLLNRTTAGYAESNACGDTSSAVRRSAQEPAEAISQNQRVAVGILSVQGEEHVNSAPAPSLYDEGDENERNRL